jgi:hypothetical protein
MSAYFKGRITALLLTVTSVWAAVPLASAASAVQLTYSLDRTGLTVNEPVLLKVVAENGTAEGVTIDLGTDFYGNFHAKLARPDGRMEIVPKPHEVLWQVGFPGAIALAAHGKVEKVLLLNRWFRFDMAGRYFLELELPEAPDSLAGSAPQVASRGEIVIDVGVRDPERLMDALDGRLRKAGKGGDDVGSEPAGRGEPRGNSRLYRGPDHCSLPCRTAGQKTAS